MSDHDDIWSRLVEWLVSHGLKRDELLVDLVSGKGNQIGFFNSDESALTLRQRGGALW
jgi:hypothetical protein